MANTPVDAAKDEVARAAYKVARDHDFTRVAQFLVNREGFSQEKVAAMQEEYTRFIAIAFAYHDENTRIGISSEVDPFWHTHILFTQDYVEFCQKVGGHYFHHEPTVTDEDVLAITPDYRNNTLELYRRNFGEPTPEFWGISSAICAYGVEVNQTIALCQYNVIPLCQYNVPVHSNQMSHSQLC